MYYWNHRTCFVFYVSSVLKWDSKVNMIIKTWNGLKSADMIIDTMRGHKCWRFCILHISLMKLQLMCILLCMFQMQLQIKQRTERYLPCSGAGGCEVSLRGDAVRSTISGLAAGVAVVLLALLWHTHWQEVVTGFLESPQFFSDWLLSSARCPPSFALAVIMYWIDITISAVDTVHGVGCIDKLRRYTTRKYWERRMFLMWTLTNS